MARLALADTLRIRPLISWPKATLAPRLKLRFAQGYPIESRRLLQAAPYDNLILRAWRLLAGEHGRVARRPIEIALLKKIPCGAGLGGGSSNAAIALVGLDKFFHLRLSRRRLLELGARLGSDVPFFLRAAWNSKTSLWWARGRGEKLRPVNLAWRSSVLLIYPGFGMSTKKAYEVLDSRRPAWLTKISILPTLLTHLKTGQRGYRSVGFNSFQDALFERLAALRRLKRKLDLMGARPALTGSGSCLYALGSQRQVRQWSRALNARVTRYITAVE